MINPAPITRSAVSPLVLPKSKSFDRTQNIAVVALGTSAGGPKSLQEVIPCLPATMPVGMLVVQHMPALFTKAFAERMDSISDVYVKEAEHGETIQPGTVYIAKGGIHMTVRRTKVLEVRIELSPYPEKAPYRPSVDVMMQSVVAAYGGRCLGVIMTGMGNDGTEGMKQIKAAGGKTLAQDEASSIVYGMPKAAADAGVVDKVAPLSSLAHEIVNMV
jgi:two-component system chemotaxis response regulator CheB